jgi:glutaredoxin
MIEVVVLTQDQCHWCDEAKAILARLAEEYALSMTTLDVATPEGEALALQSGVLFPPGIFLEKETFSYGRLSERKLRRELERRLALQKKSEVAPQKGR